MAEYTLWSELSSHRHGELTDNQALGLQSNTHHMVKKNHCENWSSRSSDIGLHGIIKNIKKEEN